MGAPKGAKTGKGMAPLSFAPKGGIPVQKPFLKQSAPPVSFAPAAGASLGKGKRTAPASSKGGFTSPMASKGKAGKVGPAPVGKVGASFTAPGKGSVSSAGKSGAKGKSVPPPPASPAGKGRTGLMAPSAKGKPAAPSFGPTSFAGKTGSVGKAGVAGKAGAAGKGSMAGKAGVAGKAGIAGKASTMFSPPAAASAGGKSRVRVPAAIGFSTPMAGKPVVSTVAGAKGGKRTIVSSTSAGAKGVKGAIGKAGPHYGIVGGKVHVMGRFATNTTKGKGKSKGKGKNRGKGGKPAPAADSPFWLDKQVEENRMAGDLTTYTGVITSYIQKAGWGFVQPDEPTNLPADVLASISDRAAQEAAKGKDASELLYFRSPDIIQGFTPTRGAPVTFKTYMDDKGAGAYDISG